MKKIFIVVASVAVLAAIIVAVLYFGNFGEPRAVVLKAFGRTLNEFGSRAALPTLNEIMKGQYRQDIALSVNKLGGNALKDADPSALAALRMFTLKDTAIYDAAAKKRQDTLSLQLAVTKLAEATIISSPSEVAVSAPLLFDYFITFDPSRYVNEWDNSFLERSAGAVWDPAMESAVYEAYRRLLFPEPVEETINSFSLEQYAAILDNETEYIYIGKETLTDGGFTKPCDRYRMTLPETAAEKLSALLIGDILKTGAVPEAYEAQLTTRLKNPPSALSVNVYIADGKVAGVTLGDGKEFAVYFTGEQINLENIHARLIIGGAVLDARLTSQTSDANGSGFTLQLSGADAGNSVTLTANGVMEAGDERFELDLDSVALNIDVDGVNLEADFSLELSVSADTGPIADTGEARSLSSVTEMDVLEMYIKLLSDPQIGALLQ
jgi:hypothetical protein